ncbi:hypothetical protein PISMIDRAFT_680596 [Pisolithus microcarpus 441]|uniref:Uncharacterized protein n=1 Tax=Pisolithus microcarpus 441 TaxID=765257 RepID=A0A0C9ZHW5_9AGAM|nr:hypothetical protein PISMIDRAFT_680596 [Pisolithus microcarpus 441]
MKRLFANPSFRPPYSYKLETDTCYDTCISVILPVIANDVMLSSARSLTSAYRLGNTIGGLRNWLVKVESVREDGGEHEPRTLVSQEVAEICALVQLSGVAMCCTYYQSYTLYGGVRVLRRVRQEPTEASVF